MKYIKEFNQFINEGINDPGILRAFFLAGGPGSGKSFVANKLFNIPKGILQTTSFSTGLKVVNSDPFFEKMLKDGGWNKSKLADYAKNPEEWEEIQKIRGRAKKLSNKRRDNYLDGRLGQIIDGTGKNFNKIKSYRDIYQKLGYDTYMIFVNTSLDVALERNRNRARKLPEMAVTEMWEQVQKNLGKFQQLFKSNHLIIVDNSSYDNQKLLRDIEKQIKKIIRKPIQNPIGKVWIKQNKR